jgi:hypothetical protein
MFMRKHDAAWPRQLKIWKISGEYRCVIIYWLMETIVFFARILRNLQPWQEVQYGWIIIDFCQIFCSIFFLFKSRLCRKFFLMFLHYFYFKKLFVIRNLLSFKKMDGEQESTDNWLRFFFSLHLFTQSLEGKFGVWTFLSIHKNKYTHRL